MPFFSTVNKVSRNGKTCLVHSDNKGNLLSWCPDDLYEEDYPDIEMLTDSVPVNSFYTLYVNDSTFICRNVSADASGQERYLLASGRRETTGAMDKLNSLSIPVKGDGYMFNILSSFSRYNKDRDVVVEASLMLNTIYLYSLDRQFERTICYGSRVDNINDVFQKGLTGLRETFTRLTIYDDFFAVMYDGGKMYEELNFLKSNPEILVFDWNGNPVAKLDLPFPADVFDIDVSSGTLYTLDREREIIRKYDIFDVIFRRCGDCQRHRQMQTIESDAISPVFLYADSLNLSEKFLAPRKVFILDEGITVFEPQDANGFLHFYDGAGNFKGKYGSIGGAKYEYISPNVFANGESVIVLSVDGRYSEIKESGAGCETVTIREIGNKSIAAGVGFLVMDSHGEIIVSSASSDDMLVFVDSSGKESGYNYYPVDNREKMDAYVMNNIISSCTYSISNRRDTLFQVFKYYPVAGVISLDDKQSVYKALAVENDNEYIVKDGIPHYEDPVLFYTYAASSRKYFYALFQNGTGHL